MFQFNKRFYTYEIINIENNSYVVVRMVEFIGNGINTKWEGLVALPHRSIISGVLVVEYIPELIWSAWDAYQKQHKNAS